MSLTYSSAYYQYQHQGNYRSPYLSARLAYMSKYLPHLVNREPISSSSSVWPSNSVPKLLPGGAGSSAVVVTHEPAPTPPERPPKKPHLRNLAHQAHEEGKDSKPPPPLPRAPVRPPALLSNGASKAHPSTGPPPIPSKPTSSSSSGGIGVTRSPSPDELPPPPPPPTAEEMELLLNDEPLPPPPPSVTENDVLLSPRSRSMSGLSSCLHKDSYMAQRKERTLGYEGRYRRTLSPSGLAWEKFHNIRPPSTTVIFTSHELSKAVGTPAASTATTSGSPQPPSSQPLFHRSISCENNIFNNKTGASQSSIPPPVAQVAPLRGSSSSSTNNSYDVVVDNTVEKSSNLSQRNNDTNMCSGRRDVIPLCPRESASSQASGKSFDDENCSQVQQQPPLSSCDNFNNIISSDNNCEKDDRYFRGAVCQTFEKKDVEDRKDQTGSRTSGGVNFSNSVLPSVIVPPLQYERCEKEKLSNGVSNISLHSHSTENQQNSVLKKSEVSLRVNCTSVVALQTGLVNGSSQKENEVNGVDNRRHVSYSSSIEPGLTVEGNTPPTSTLEGCQTNKGCSLSSTNNTSNSTASFYTGRQKTQEELECEELSRDIAKMLPQGDKLQTLLVPLPDHKTTADYMEGLFHLELKLQPETVERRASLAIGADKSGADLIQEQGNPVDQKSKLQLSPALEETSQTLKTATTTPALEVNSKKRGSNNLPEVNKDCVYNTNGTYSSRNSDSVGTPLILSSAGDPKVDSTNGASDANVTTPSSKVASYRRCNGHAPLPADSAYFTTSECKAKFLTQYNNDIKKEPISGTEGEELDKQKEELVSRISRKLEILRTEQHLLREEIQSNEQLGQMVVERVKQAAKRNEFDKFKLHVEEIEKITSLLLGISGRLARAENALMGLGDPPNPQEKKILESKRDKLREQLDEAKILKENIDRRSAQVSNFLQKYLTAEEYADYDHFVKMKAKLIIDAREIDDKIKLGEEQLGALKDALSTLPLSPNSSSA